MSPARLGKGILLLLLLLQMGVGVGGVKDGPDLAHSKTGTAV